MLSLTTDHRGLVALTSLLGVGCSTQPHFCPGDIHLSVPLHFRCYQHTQSCTGSAGLDILWQLWWKGKISLVPAAAQELCPGWGKGAQQDGWHWSCCHSTAGHGWEGLKSFKAHFAQGIIPLLHTDPEQPAPASTASSQTLLVFEEIPWESLKNKTPALGADCKRWKLKITESFTLF